ncbi:MAG: MBL fold metallo-hydrolase [Thermoanaerobacteraceae bacterium]|nr:MBL fold metallo-hydrolase [Thermoanaerobacteraceae bacterium]
MQLNRINDRVYYIEAPVNMGLIVNDRREALLVDTGIDDSVARKVKRLVTENGYSLKGIIITHAHADHSGGAAHLVKTTGAKVYATAPEKAVLEFPLWEPLYLFGGAYPPASMHHKFLLAPAVRVDEVMEPGRHNLDGFEVDVVALPGHTPGQVGVSAHGVLFCADAVIAPGVLDKHGIPLNVHLKQALATYDLLEERPENYFLPAHGSLVADIAPVVAANRTRVHDVLAFILSLLKDQRSLEEILAPTCTRFGVDIGNTGQYYLMHLTIMAYMGYLLDRGEIEVSYHGNRQEFVRSGGGK